MELRHLNYFIAVAEELHFGRAAKRLHLSQPPLSKQIQELEAELGTRLFDRTTQRVSLTQAGAAFLPWARKVIEDAEHAKLTAKRASRGELGRVGIGFVASSLYSILPNIVARFSRRYPEVEVTLQHISSRSMLDALREGRVDVGFARSPASNEELVIEGKMDEDLVVALPEDHILAKSSSIELLQLQDEQLMFTPTRVEQSVYFEILEACARFGFRPRFTPHLVQDAPDLQSALPLVAAGLGITLVPASWQAVRLPGLVFRPLIAPAPTIELVIMRRAGELRPVVDTFLRAARAQLVRS